MINFVPELRIFLCTGHVDMRKSYDGLYGVVSRDFQRDVQDGGLFLFLNRRRDRIKLFYWDHDGLAIWMKKLEEQHPHFLPFTEIGEYPHNLAIWPVAAV